MRTSKTKGELLAGLMARLQDTLLFRDVQADAFHRRISLVTVHKSQTGTSKWGKALRASTRICTLRGTPGKGQADRARTRCWRVCLTFRAFRLCLAMRAAILAGGKVQSLYLVQSGYNVRCVRFIQISLVTLGLEIV